MSETAKTYERHSRAEEVSTKFAQIDQLLSEIVELGATNQRVRLGLQHMLNKHTRQR